MSVSPAAKPNILFIVADDLNSWIEPLGRHPQVRTPNINRLAAGGTVFTRAYCTAPYCNASRMSVFSGCLPTNTGVYENEPFWEGPLRRKTFLEHLREAGYYCFGAGKVFHGTFDYAMAGRERSREALWRDTENRMSFWDDFRPNRSEPMPPNRPLNRMFDFDNFEKVSPWNHLFDWGVLPSEREADTPDARSVAAISEFLNKPKREPFFCAAGLYKPHLPWYAPQRFFDIYPLDEVTLPFVKSDDLDDVPEIARSWALSPTRVPFILVPPASGGKISRVDSPVSLIDIFPSLCELVGIGPIEGVDGVSLASLMKGEVSSRGGPVVTTWKRGNHSIRTGQWRFTRYKDGSEELYDQNNDPYEWTNLVGNSHFEHERVRLRAQIEPFCEPD